MRLNQLDLTFSIIPNLAEIVFLKRYMYEITQNHLP